MALVYLVTNTVNNKRYVGFTSQKLSDRKQQHLHSANVAKPKMVFSKAIKKYGMEKFRFEIVRDNLSEAKALKLEERMIRRLKPEYNVASGGRNPSYKSKWKPVILLDAGMIFQNAEQAGKDLDIDKYFIRRACLAEQKGRGAISAHGMHFAYYHDGFTEEELQARLAALKCRKQSHTKVRGFRRPVVCVTDGNRCASLKDAADRYGLCHKYVRKLCYTGETTKDGLRFMYEDQGAPVKPKPRENKKALAARKNGLLAVNAPIIPVVCLNDNAVHPSKNAAAKAYGISATSVYRSIKNNRPIKSGLRFVYQAS